MRGGQKLLGVDRTTQIDPLVDPRGDPKTERSSRAAGGTAEQVGEVGEIGYADRSGAASPLPSPVPGSPTGALARAHADTVSLFRL